MYTDEREGSHEDEESQRVGYGEEECRDKILPKAAYFSRTTLALLNAHLQVWLREHHADAEENKDNSTCDEKEGPVGLDELGDHGDAEACDHSVEKVGRGCTAAACEARAASLA